MPIDISIETLKTPAEAAKATRRHVASVYRSFFNGTEGVLCEHVKIGGKTFTSLEALQRFADRVTTARAARRSGVPIGPPRPAAPAGRTAAKRNERAECQLDAAGIKVRAARRKGRGIGVR